MVLSAQTRSSSRHSNANNGPVEKQGEVKLLHWLLMQKLLLYCMEWN